jgi:DNA-binding transcriptional regulator YiaG
VYRDGYAKACKEAPVTDAASPSSPEPGPAPEPTRAAGAPAEEWDAGGVRRLRRFLGASQAELADRLGTRQQTVSEWETGARRPRRMSRRLLRLVAEEAGYYGAGGAAAADDGAPR